MKEKNALLDNLLITGRRESHSLWNDKRLRESRKICVIVHSLPFLLSKGFTDVPFPQRKMKTPAQRQSPVCGLSAHRPYLLHAGIP